MLFLFLLLLSIPVFAQQTTQFCGTDEYAFELFQSHPELQQLMLQKREELKQHTDSYVQQVSAGRSSDSLLLIPVVFHVIHNYGNENISDAQILSGLQILNRNFRKQHPDTASIEAIYKPLAADCEIEFRLARKDPDGNCTNGINRIATPITINGYHNVKNLVHWDPAKYLNIYVVKQIPGLAGYCLMPDQAAAKPEWDGIVIAHNYVGNIGTANDVTSVSLSHEVGHFLNLFHIWGGNNVPDYYYLPVGQQSNCGESDEVDDTPPTIGWSSCQHSNASCGNTVDNYQNMMDYSYCNIMFTEGQKQRMRACLHSAVAGRNNLVSAANLIATGVLEPDSTCMVKISASQNYACLGDSIRFFDNSLIDADAWEWDFGDGDYSYEKNPAHEYYSDGTMNVILTLTKNSVQLQSKPLKIYLHDYVSRPAFVQNFETIHYENESGFFIFKENENVQLSVLQNIGFNSTKCGGFLFEDTLKYSGKISLLSPILDLSNTPDAALYFNYYCTQKKSNNNDALEVSFSNDCGKTWSSSVKYTGANLPTIATEVQDAYTYSSDTSNWKTVQLPISESYRNESFQFKIDVLNYYGNNFLIDNVNVNPELYTSVQNIADNDLQIYPNPALDKISVKYALQAFEAKIYDIYRREIASVIANNNADIDVSNLPQGIYILSLFNGDKIVNKKFNKQ